MKLWIYRIMSEKKYDKNGNLIYEKYFGWESWKKYNENNNLIHYKDSDGYEIWREYDGNNNIIYSKSSTGFESWSKYDENNNKIKITEKELKELIFQKKEKEYLSRKKCSRFEIIDI